MIHEVVDRFEELLSQDQIAPGRQRGEEIKNGMMLVAALAVLIGTGLLLILGAPIR